MCLFEIEEAELNVVNIFGTVSAREILARVLHDSIVQTRRL